MYLRVFFTLLLFISSASLKAKDITYNLSTVFIDLQKNDNGIIYIKPGKNELPSQQEELNLNSTTILNDSIPRYIDLIRSKKDKQEVICRDVKIQLPTDKDKYGIWIYISTGGIKPNIIDQIEPMSKHCKVIFFEM